MPSRDNPLGYNTPWDIYDIAVRLSKLTGKSIKSVIKVTTDIATDLFRLS